MLFTMTFLLCTTSNPGYSNQAMYNVPGSLMFSDLNLEGKKSSSVLAALSDTLVARLAGTCFYWTFALLLAGDVIFWLCLFGPTRTHVDSLRRFNGLASALSPPAFDSIPLIIPEAMSPNYAGSYEPPTPLGCGRHEQQHCALRLQAVWSFLFRTTPCPNCL
jgi:hypothetical protein